MTVRRHLALVSASAASGLLLFLSDHPVHLIWLQLVAFVPFLLALARLATPRLRDGALAGLALGLGVNLPLLVVLEFPLAMGLGLALALSAFWAVVGAGGVYMIRWPTPVGPLAVAALAVVVEWVSYRIVPVWGTAQCFVRVWSAVPPVAALASVGGMALLVFVVVGAQALAVTVVQGGTLSRRAATALVVLLGASTTAAAIAWRRPTGPRQTVAAVGWTDAERRGPEATFAEVYVPLVDEAVGRGASLVVSPEVGFTVDPALVDRWLYPELARLARRHGVWLVTGYFNGRGREGTNEAVIVSPDGDLVSRYRKTHLIPTLESYQKGDGRPAQARIDDADVGILICQDDNFVDLAARYGRRGADLVAVPTNDWAQVAPYHLENALFRGIENGYATVRAASNGASVIVSPHGEVLASLDHVAHGPGVIVASVAVGKGRTPYAVAGDWLPGAAAIFLVAAGLSRRRRKPTT